eukprot:gene12252-13514_t
MDFKAIAISAIVTLLLIMHQLTHYVIDAAPLGCGKPKDPTKALDEIDTNYFVGNLKFASPDVFQHQNLVGNTVRSKGCKYTFVETKKNPDQYPQTLITAECKKGHTGRCDRRCKPIKYSTTVLKLNKDCNPVFGLRTWSLEQVSVTIGFEMKVRH